MRTKLRIGLGACLGFMSFMVVAPTAWAQAVTTSGTDTGAGTAGECPDGMCGATVQDGGGCSCSCGCGSLVAGTDIGVTYSTTDDYDGDGFADNFDNCPFVFNKDQTDSDGDKIGDACDNCAHNANFDQSDINGNGVGDICDNDEDGDGINDKGTPNYKNAAGVPMFDNCAAIPNPDQATFPGGDPSLGALCDPAYLSVDCSANPSSAACTADTDKDGVADKFDNCIAVWNPDQTNTNKLQEIANGTAALGDACDSDIDGDGVLNNVDNCPTMYNPPSKNSDGSLQPQNDGDKNGYGDNWDASGTAVAGFSSTNTDPNGQSNGVQLCNPTGFCFSAANNKNSACLDPAGVFQVTATPEAQSPVGEPVYLGILANRQNTGIKYSWKVSTAPAGSSSVVSNPVGAVSKSNGWEYTYTGARPTFTPDHAGSYTLTLSADLATPDATYPSQAHAENTVNLVVTGTSKNGCKQTDATAMGLLAALGVVGYGLLRRRKA